MLSRACSVTGDHKAISSICAMFTAVVMDGGASGVPAPFFLFFTTVSILVTRTGVLWAWHQGRQ